MIMIDIEMPEKCGLCPCFHFDNPMYCQAVKADKNKKIVNPYGSPRPEWCPLKEKKAVYRTGRTSVNGYSIIWTCGSCGADLHPNGAKAKYCSQCGTPVLWDAVKS